MPKQKANKSQQNKITILFDLDGTLIDSVYQHVLAWGEALREAGVKLPNWMIHRKIGMSDELIVHAFLRDAGVHLSKGEIEELREFHGKAYAKLSREVRALPGARDLLTTLLEARVPHAIATRSPQEQAQRPLKMLGISSKVPAVRGMTCRMLSQIQTFS